MGQASYTARHLYTLSGITATSKSSSTRTSRFEQKADDMQKSSRQAEAEVGSQKFGATRAWKLREDIYKRRRSTSDAHKAVIVRSAPFNPQRMAVFQHEPALLNEDETSRQSRTIATALQDLFLSHAHFVTSCSVVLTPRSAYTVWKLEAMETICFIAPLLVLMTDL